MSEKINNSLTGIAKRYSKALIDAATEKNQLDITADELKVFYEMYLSSKNLQDALCAPTIKLNEKYSIIDELTSSFKNNTVKDFLFLLAQEGRYNAFETIYYYFTEGLNTQKNIAEVEVKSVIELDDEQKNKLIQKLSKKLGKTINAKYTTSPDIIGGLVISYEDKTVDLSIKSKFEDLKKQLI